MELWKTLAPGGEARVVRVDRTHISFMANGSESAMPHSTELARLRLAVGDYVSVNLDATLRLIPRTSSLTRGISTPPFVQVLAANIDVVLLAMPARAGARPGLIERMAAIGWASGAQPHFLVTKSDLVGVEELNMLPRDIERHAPGVPVLCVSSKDGFGLEELRALIADAGTGVLIGHSGVGKSSVINALLGTERLPVGSTRARDSKGRHTTTRRELVHIPSGGFLIDTPGVRELGLDIEQHDIDRAFTDVTELSMSCRFRDCRHDQEPGCRVREAIAENQLELGRLASMQRLEREVLHAENRRRSRQREKSTEWTRHAREYRRARGN